MKESDEIRPRSRFVDDILIVSPLVILIKWFKEEFTTYYKVKDLKETKRILGIRIRRNRAKRMMYLDQEAYIEKML